MANDPNEQPRQPQPPPVRRPPGVATTYDAAADAAVTVAAARGSRRTVFRVARLLASGFVALALWACGPVYIPVPPPGEISFTSELVTDSTGATRTVWITSGGPNGNAASATFYVIDEERAAGVIARARPDGSFTASPMDGNLGDHVVVYYRDMTGRDSLSSCVLLSEATVADRCPP